MYTLDLFFHTAQHALFFLSKARYKIIHKGRRFGLTIAFAFYVIYYALTVKKPVLWIDTSYPNIKRYFDRYFRPRLKKLPKGSWKWDLALYTLHLGDTYVDFRSATHPDNIEGFGYGLVVINEAGIVLKNPRIWTESVRPMMMEHKADALIGGTPKGKRLRKFKKDHPFYELAQMAAERNAAGDERWAVFNYSTYDNPYLDPDEVRDLERDMPPGLREQEIHGKFVDLGGESILRAEWWQWYEVAPHFDYVFQSWDTAFKEKETNDWSVCTTWGIANRNLYCLDMWRGRVPFPVLEKTARRLIERFRPHRVVIEDKSSGTSLIQIFQAEGIPVKAVNPEGDKVLRAHKASLYLERGQVHLPQGLSWTSTLVSECDDFPESEDDDIVDTVTQAVDHAKAHLDAPPERVSLRDRERKAPRRRGSGIVEGY